MQQEELRTANESLEIKAKELQHSEEELRLQSELLKKVNVDLEERAGSNDDF
jgi:hypothetical protein